MDCQTTWSVTTPPCGPAFSACSTISPAFLTGTLASPAKQIHADQRQGLAIQVLAGIATVSGLARELEVSRKFVYHQVHTAQQALQQAFEPPSPRDNVLFYLPVTKAWLRQLILALVLICHSSYRGVIELLQDLFDYPISLGTVHNVVHSAVPQSRRINQQYDLSTIKNGAHDEIFQGYDPVLVGVDTASTFCYLLSLEDHRNAETWGIRLLELVDRGYAPEATIGDGGDGLRAGQKLTCLVVCCECSACRNMTRGVGLRKQPYVNNCVVGSGKSVKLSASSVAGRFEPVPWWRTSTVGCGATFSCAATWGRTI